MKLPSWTSPDVQCFVFLGWALPLTGWLAREVFARNVLAGGVADRDVGAASNQGKPSATGCRVGAPQQRAGRA